MKISVITLFPEMFHGPFAYSIIKRAVEKKIVEISYINIRDFGIGKHRTVDDTPYGGGAGMLLRVDVVEKAIFASRCKNISCKERVILLDAGGNTFTQKKAGQLSSYEHLIFVTAHYEGIDERIRSFIDEEISIGDYVLTGGEIPAMVIIDSIVRLIPHVLGKDKSNKEESFQEGEIGEMLLEHPHYTKPDIYKSLQVPKVLLSGNHKEIAQWRNEQSVKRTKKIRPDLLIIEQKEKNQQN